MDANRWAQVEALFHELSELPEAQRESTLKNRTGEDIALYNEVWSLLTAGGGERFTGIVGQVAANAGEQLQTDRVLPVGHQLGAYTIDHLIGEGGMGQVYAATQEEPVRRTVALKLIRYGAGDPRILARFEGERQALAMMDHSAIARVFDGGTTDEGTPYFVMERVQGTPIDDYLTQTALPFADTIRLFVAICRGVQHAHQKGIIHRDLKPSNLLIIEGDEGPLPKIIDFGIAKATTEPIISGATLTNFGQVLGTPRYMSPEQADSQGMDVDTRCDVWALGTIFYELLTGSHPLDVEALSSPSAATRSKAYSDARVESPSQRARSNKPEIARKLKGDLDWVLHKALELDRTRRYGAAGELADDLERALHHLPVEAGPPTAGYRLRKFYQRHRLPVLAASAVMVSLIIGLTAATTGFVRARDAEADAIAKANTAEAVSAYLIDLFRSSDPNELDTANLSARELLAIGSERLDERLGDQPATRAQLLLTIGQVYTNLSLYQEALRHLEEALVFFESQPAPSLELAQTLLIRSEARAQLKQGDSALADGQRALALLDRLQSEPTALTGRAWSSVGNAFVALGRYDEALPAFETASQIAASTTPDTTRHATSLYNLAGLHFISGRVQEAIPFVEASIEIWEAIDPRLPRLADAYDGLGQVKYSLGRIDEAREHMTAALSTRVANYGSNNTIVGDSHGNLAQLELSVGKVDTAISHIEQAIAIFKGAGDEAEGAPIAATYELWAIALLEKGEVETAHEAVQQALVHRETSTPKDHPDYVLAREVQASVESARGNHRAAIALQQQVINHREPLLGTEHPEIHKLYAQLGDFHLNLGVNAETDRVFETLVAMLEASPHVEWQRLKPPLMRYLDYLKTQSKDAPAILTRALLQSSDR